MRIAYLLESTELSGGVKVVCLQAEALARRGHRVTVVSPEAASDWFALLRALFEHSSFRDSEEIARADVRVATFWTTVAPALSGARGPVFHLCQGYEGAFAFYADHRQAIEKAYRASTRKLAISAALAARLGELGFGPAVNVGQAFDPIPFFPALPREPAIPLVLLVGPSQADVKGIDVGIEGLRLWRERGGFFRLCRISTLPPLPEEHSSSLIDSYHQLLDPARMPFAYRASDIFVGPSRPEEGFGLPVLEALATGLPCLLSDTPTHREIAGDAAWYFPDGSPEGLATALPELATARARSRARALGPPRAARFDAARVAERLEQVFLRSLSGASETPARSSDGGAAWPGESPQQTERP